MSDPNHGGSAAQFRSLLRSLVLDPGLVFNHVLSAENLAAAVAQEVGKTCDRIFTPVVTLCTFLAQVLSDDHSCRAAVARLLAWRAARGLPACSADTGGYCKARQRLPEALLQRLVRESADRLQLQASQDWLCHGRRVVIADGSTVSMPDTPANQKAYPQHGNQKPGCGFPIARIVVLLSLATGCVLEAAIGSSKGKLTGEHALLRGMHRRLKPGDILLGDAYYSSFDEVALLLAEGVDVVMRQAGNRRTDFRQGQKLGREDHLVVWERHRNRPAWMDRLSFRRLPRQLLMRELRVRVDRPGFRTREFVVVTSLRDAELYSPEELAGLYRARWHAELDLRSMKQTMKMDVLRCQTPELVRKEFWAHLLAYNLIRGVMAEAARGEGIKPRAVSFKGAQHTMREFEAVHLYDPERIERDLPRLVSLIGKKRVGDRPDRYEPRAVKRRPKPHPLLRMTRKKAKALIKRGFIPYEKTK
jgi:hypothetical protein